MREPAGDSSAPLTVGIVADDLTGANDAAVQFARRGWETRLVLSDPASATCSPGSVVAVVTDARAQTDENAHSATASAIAGLVAAGVDRIFVKIDSTMRGSVRAQIEGALEAWSAEHPSAIAVVCPAYPSMGRTIDHGDLLVDGVGVETTSVGHDPVTPVLTRSLRDLLPGSVGVRAGHAVGLAGVIVQADARIVVLDASTDDDLEELAKALLLLGPRAVPIGSAGLAVALADAWLTEEQRALDAQAAQRPVSDGRVVVQVSSLHDTSRRQHDHLRDSLDHEAIRVFAPTIDEASGTEAAGSWIAAQLKSDPALPTVVTVLSPAERGHSAGSGSVAGTPAERIAAGLAIITDTIVGHAGAGTLVLLGGEGARAVLERLDADAILVTDAIREGIPIGSIEGGRMHGLTVVTKAGGFGAETTLTEILPELLGSTRDPDQDRSTITPPQQGAHS